ncbi:MAG: protein translocase subunit SecD [Patescibacteria group bacterium]
MKSKLTDNQKIGISLITVGILTIFTVLTTIPNGPDLFGKQTKLHLGLDLQGGTHLVFQADTSKIAEADKQSAVDGAKDAIEKRINVFGVSEPLVQTSKVGNDYRVIVELPGVTDTAKAIKMIGETPLLEFKTQNENPNVLTDAQKKEISDYNTAAKAKIEDLKNKIKNGASFEDIAKQYSEDTTTKSVGGDLGFITENGSYSELYKEAKTMKDSWFSWNTIENEEGYNLIKRVSEKTDGKEVSASHLLICYKGTTGCDKETTEAEAKAKIEDLRSKFLLSSTNREAAFTKLVKENSTEPNASTTGGDLGWFSKGQMVKEFEDVVFDMKDNSISEVVKTEFGYHLIFKKAGRPLNKINVKRILVAKKTEANFLQDNAWVNTELSGKYLKSSKVSFTTSTNEPEVTLSFDDTGKKLFAEITEKNVGKRVAIFLDGNVISAPTVNTAITGGEAVIGGGFSLQEAKELSTRLNSGALPVPVTLLNQKHVGPTLGQESLNKSFLALIVGFSLVAIYMIILYRLPGIVSVIALGIYALINVSLFKLIPVTVTVSGIAGFILSIGMAVDANVLIFERMKEELRDGKDLIYASKTGFNRAWPSIRDGNVTTLIICFILYTFGSSSVKGFGLTLAIGILTSMFTAITVTRIMLLALAKTKLSKFASLWAKNKKEAVK